MPAIQGTRACRSRWGATGFQAAGFEGPQPDGALIAFNADRGDPPA